MNTNHQDDQIESLLKKYQDEQREFENHWLWQELGTTPQKFFKRIRQYIQESGIDKRIWDQKLAEAKKALEVRLKENTGHYEPMDFKMIQGLNI